MLCHFALVLRDNYAVEKEVACRPPSQHKALFLDNSKKILYAADRIWRLRLMDFTLIGILGLLALLLLLFLGLHMGVDFILVGLLGLTILINFKAAMSLLGETLYNAIASPTFCVLPLFILMGAFASRGGFAGLAYSNVHKICARLPGALAIATSFGCAIFASICGSTIATATIFGRIAYPERSAITMRRVMLLERSHAPGVLRA